MVLPSPTATTSPPCGLDWAVVGSNIPPAVLSSVVLVFTSTLSPNGLTDVYCTYHKFMNTSALDKRPEDCTLHSQKFKTASQLTCNEKRTRIACTRAILGGISNRSTEGFAASPLLLSNWYLVSRNWSYFTIDHSKLFAKYFGYRNPSPNCYKILS
jgi:hypothetical protein